MKTAFIKRTLAVALSLIMMLGMMPINVFAADSDYISFYPSMVSQTYTFNGDGHVVWISEGSAQPGYVLQFTLHTSLGPTLLWQQDFLNMKVWVPDTYTVYYAAFDANQSDEALLLGSRQRTNAVALNTVVVEKANPTYAEVPKANNTTNSVSSTSSHPLVTAGTSTLPDYVQVQYKSSGAGTWTDWSTDIPVATSNGIYTVEYKLSRISDTCVVNGANYAWNRLFEFSEQTGSVTVRVGPDAEVTTLPVAKESITYSGTSEQLLSSLGSAVNGTLQYAVTSASQKNAPTSGWSTTAPTATDAGDYKVWYKAAAFYQSDTTPAYVTATIKGATPVVTDWPDIKDICVGDTLDDDDLVGSSATVEGSFSITGDKTWSTVGTKYTTLTFTPTNKNYTTVTNERVPVTVIQATATAPADPAAQNEITYGQKLSEVGLTAGWTWADGSIVPTVTNSGYPAYYTPADTVNYDWSKVEGWNAAKGRVERTVAVTVKKALLTVTANDTAITYGDAPANNGVSYSGFVNGETENMLDGTLEYDHSYAQYGDVGNYDITPKGLTSDNYEIAFQKGALTVKQKEIGIAWSNTTLTYNGTAQKPTATATKTVNGDQIALTVEGAEINAADTAYTATVTAITGDKKDNYTLPSERSTDYFIQKATYDMKDARWDYTEAFKYDGLKQTVSVIGLPTGVTVKDYSGNTETVVGEYTAKVTFNYDSGNYNEPALADLNWKIENNWTPTEYTVSAPNDNGWLNNDFVVTAADGYKVSLTNTADGEWSNSLTYGAETAEGSVTFYLKSKTDGTISLAKTENYKLDKTNPTGTVEFVERKSWQEFVNTITFGLFYKDEVTVKVTASDNLSGEAKIEYIESANEMSLDEVKAAESWTAMPANGVGVTIEDTKQFIYYVRITDNAGNVTYLSTNGAEYDTTAPVISGVENGETYYTTQVVTVEDKNLASVELDGETVTLDNGSLTLAGNVDATYTIKVTDKAGNIIEYTVTMKTIAELTKSLDDITVGDVTSDDKEIIEQVIGDIDEQLANDDLTEDEKAALEETKDKAQDLLDKIDEAANADDTENTQKVKDVTAENVTPENKTDLEGAKTDLEKALDEHGNNMTEDEKKAIEDEIKRIDDALKVIGNVEAVEELIDKLPENITKNDEAAIKAADDALGALSDYEKSLVGEDAKKALDDAKAALAELNKPADTTSPNTGDNSNMFLWIALLFISGGAVIMLIVVDRKRRTV